MSGDGVKSEKYIGKMVLVIGLEGMEKEWEGDGVGERVGLRVNVSEESGRREKRRRREGGGREKERERGGEKRKKEERRGRGGDMSRRQIKVLIS